jgi:hypothetical protein
MARHSTAATEPLGLLALYEVTPLQRQAIMAAASRPASHRAWFIEQFTRNRPAPLANCFAPLQNGAVALPRTDGN